MTDERPRLPPCTTPAQKVRGTFILLATLGGAALWVMGGIRGWW